jgi:hypothetical protein
MNIKWEKAIIRNKNCFALGFNEDTPTFQAYKNKNKIFKMIIPILCKYVTFESLSFV